MWRIEYYDFLGLVDVSFGINDEEIAKEHAEKHSKELAKEFGHTVTYKISKDNENND